MPRIGAYLATLLLIAGCTMGELWADQGDPIDLRPGDLTGTWHSTPDREITFAADGTFTATNLPTEAFSNFAIPPGPLDGSGTWSVDTSEVALVYRLLADTEVRMSGPNLTALRENNVDNLYFFYVGAGGNSWTAYQK